MLPLVATGLALQNEMELPVGHATSLASRLLFASDAPELEGPGWMTPVKVSDELDRVIKIASEEAEHEGEGSGAGGGSSGRDEQALQPMTTADGRAGAGFEIPYTQGLPHLGATAAHIPASRGCGGEAWGTEEVEVQGACSPSPTRRDVAFARTHIDYSVLLRLQVRRMRLPC